jgi:hypothetical protein
MFESKYQSWFHYFIKFIWISYDFWKVQNVNEFDLNNLNGKRETLLFKWASFGRPAYGLAAHANRGAGEP